jgi:hypothetical protein
MSHTLPGPDDEEGAAGGGDGLTLDPVQWELAGSGGDYPGLRHLFGAYLNRSSMEDNSDWRVPIQEFKGEDPEAVPEVVDDLENLVNADLSEGELERILMELGCGSYRDGGRGSWRAWLVRVRNELAR